MENGGPVRFTLYSLLHDTQNNGLVRWDGEEMPRRAITPGLHMGLTVTLNSRVEEQFCTSFQSSGFKGLLHVPISQPEMVEYGFALSPGTENFLDLNPKTIRAGGSFLLVMEHNTSSRAIN